MPKWIVKGWDPIKKQYWCIADFDSKIKAVWCILRTRGLHMGNLHKGGE